MLSSFEEEKATLVSLLGAGPGEERLRGSMAGVGTHRGGGLHFQKPRTLKGLPFHPPASGFFTLKTYGVKQGL